MSTAVAVCYGGGVFLPGGVCPVGCLPARGVCVCPEGCLPAGGGDGVHLPPVDRQTPVRYNLSASTVKTCAPDLATGSRIFLFTDYASLLHTDFSRKNYGLYQFNTSYLCVSDSSIIRRRSFPGVWAFVQKSENG